MDTSKLKNFAKSARLSLIEQVSSKLYQVLKDESAERREFPQVMAKLEEALEDKGGQVLIDQVSYTWFNRFCALRFMDANGYNRIGVVSPAEGQVQPEILAEAKAGHIDDTIVRNPQTRERVLGLLNGSINSRDAQAEAYRLLIVAVCNHYNTSMPFLFEQIQDFTELLMPDDLLSDNSILDATRQAMTTEQCENVEVIGWLYQFYISEKKDDVFAALKKGKKITPENIPAATQLFTPHWIVRYLVENSLGRLWMLNHPDSKLFQNMKDRGEDCYYIEPEEPETDFLKIDKPEDIKLSDPACGSGHMLTYAFDLMYAIYEEQGYDPVKIPQLILTHNLFGIEIDPRAGALAAFALTMKAREKYSRFLTGNKAVQPNICVLENISFEPDELSAYMDKVGRDLFSNKLQEMLGQWEEADNFGSLIRPAVADVSEVMELLNVREMVQDLLLAPVHQKVLKALRQADYLSTKYHVVTANPPYFGSKGMSHSLKKFASDEFELSKSDLFAMFIERSFDSVAPLGYTGMITMQSWIFLTSYEKLRRMIIDQENLITFAHFGSRAFDTIGGEVVATCGFTLQKADSHEAGTYIRLTEGRTEAEKREALLRAVGDLSDPLRFSVEKSKFRSITGMPIAYWVSDRVRSSFSGNQPLTSYFQVKEGTTTGDTKRFLRLWHEVSIGQIGFGYPSSEDAKGSGQKWFPYLKGGEFKRWYGNHEYIVNWKNDGTEIRNYSGSTPRGTDRYFQANLNWTKVSSSSFSVRYSPEGYCFDTGGLAMFPSDVQRPVVLGLLNSKVIKRLVSALSLTLNYTVGNIGSLPFKTELTDESRIVSIANRCVSLLKDDWNSNEASWDFLSNSLLSNPKRNLLEQEWSIISKKSDDNRYELKRLEEENNRIFIAEYKLEAELSPDVEVEELSIERFDSKEVAENFISYAVGCMLGRYSLDKPGLILANQGDTVENYYAQVPEPSFRPDEENVIPLLDGDWFTDDISERFKKFLKVTFGTEHFDENLTFLENALYPDNLTGKKRKTIRDYFLKEFYNHHVKLYKKRPIYWLFSSPKGTFSALIYMHRYRPDTVSVVLNKYLREFQIKLQAKKESLEQISINTSASPREKTQALKEIAKHAKMLVELKDYERDVLYPLATQNIEIDLDDGVKVNYPKFGKALKKVTGLS